MTAPTPLPPLTDWFPPHIKPVRPGVYEIEDDDGTGIRWFRAWRGFWCLGGPTPGSAALQRQRMSDQMTQAWRGLSARTEA